MTHPENHKPLWTESRVESLLEDFFRKEMPSALRGQAPELPPRGRSRLSTASSSRQSQTAKTRANSMAGVLMVGISSLLMLMLAFITWHDSSFSKSVNSSTGSSRSHAAELESDPLNALKHDGQGPIESRSRIQSVGTEDLLNPGQKPPFPELDIEVYPLDRESPEKGPEQSRRPESRRTNSQRSPMPEENRQLPESDPPASTDPDEARSEPVLPEIRAISDGPLAI
jgi:hypothetical protein